MGREVFEVPFSLGNELGADQGNVDRDISTGFMKTQSRKCSLQIVNDDV